MNEIKHEAWTIDFRCPVEPRHLFLKLKSQGRPTPVVEGNLLELACDVCKKIQRQRQPDVIRVLHRFNILGEWIETEVVRAEPPKKS